ncbi:MAG TPA: hypothetical protein VEJ44_03755, partial [Acidimicrobiales bacterium]|nr:hypothetical protein [Acidimicrobiales bacterium]
MTANYSEVSVNQAGHGQSDLCTDAQPPSPTHPGVIQLQVTVTWNHGQQSLTDTTNITYPRPGLQTEGFLGIQVENNGGVDASGNSAATRLEAVPIAVTGPVSLTLYPDQNGCAFAQVPTGAYTVSVSQPSRGTPSDFTGWNGSPPFVLASPINQPPAVTVTSEADTNVTFDEGINAVVSYGGASAVAGGVVCPSGANLTCLALGSGTSQASVAWGASGSTWSATTLSGTTTISQVACTSAASATCVGVGYGSGGGVILTTSSDLGSSHIHADTVPSGVTDITQVTCPSSNGCYALGTKTTGPVLLAGAVGQTAPAQDTWAVVAPAATTFASLSSIACPTTTTCELGEVGAASATAPGILRLDGDPATLATNSAWTPTFTLENTPATLTSVGKIVCPSSTECEATATQNDSSGIFDPAILTSSIASTPPSDWLFESTFPQGSKAISGLSCTSSACVAVGSSPSTSPLPAVWTGNLASAPHDWTTASGVPGLASTIATVSAVSCGVPQGTATANCVLSATTSSATGELVVGTLTSGSWAWSVPTLTTSSSVLYFTGLACQAPGTSGSVCAAAAATSTGPAIFTAPTPTGTWSLSTPSSLPGATVLGIPLETTPAGVSSWTTQVAAATGAANATSLPNVMYPYPGGYSIVAGDCAAEATSTDSSPFSAPPGGTATATVQLGLLSLQVLTPLGATVSGATV